MHSAPPRRRRRQRAAICLVAAHRGSVRRGLANNGGVVHFGSDPYAHPSALFDVVGGSNGTCSPSYLCTAVAGYDGPTGLGTPNGTAAF